MKKRIAFKTNPKFRLAFGGLQNGDYDYDIVANIDDFEYSDSLREFLVKDIDVKATLSKKERTIVLTIQTKAMSHFNCDRCLREFVLELNGEYEQIFVYERYRGTVEMDDPFVEFVSDGEKELYLENDIRETVMLSVPIKKLCGEEDCDIYQDKTQKDKAADSMTEWQEKLKEATKKFIK